MAKPKWNPDREAETAELAAAPAEMLGENLGERLGFSLSGLFTVDLQRQTVRIATAVGATVANHPDNRVDFDLTGGTLTIPPGWRVINF